MKSQLIEFFRFNSQDTGMLRPGDRYLLVRGDEPACEVCVTIDHADFMELLDLLRYGSNTDEAERQEALGKLANAVSAMLGSVAKPSGTLQIDLVTNAAELAALPFELAADDDGRPVFAGSDPPLVLTRRVRRGSHGERPAWWSKPRVLFAVASPPPGEGVPVPMKEHLDALRQALKPWIEPLEGFPEAIPDERSVLSILENASLESIKQAGQEAIDEKRPYTHLHILAHGCAIGKAWKQRFGLALRDSGDGAQMAKISPEDLCTQLAPIAEQLVVVTLAACDGGNQANSIAGGGSMAHELHSSGIPVVVASQFPLTFDGSVIFTRTFYEKMLGGHDVRAALHSTRSDLHQQLARIGHDWASLVAYVQLPEDYVDRQVEVGLKAELASLRTGQLWSDHIVNNNVRDPGALEKVADRLQERISNLKAFQLRHASRMSASARDENLGLLGSAEKRLAELYFRGAMLGNDRAMWMSRSEQALVEARGWYGKAFVKNLSHHWSGVQALALEAVLTGHLSRVGHWYAAKEAAEADFDDPENREKWWAAGSLAELFLLGRLAGVAGLLDEAKSRLGDLIATANEANYAFPIESTERQLKRYTTWWTKENGYFGDAPDLSAEAEQLLVFSPSVRRAEQAPGPDGVI